MRVAIATAILGAVLVASPGSQTIRDGRPSDALDRAFSQNGRIRMDLVAGDYQIIGGKEDRIRIEWSVRDAESLPRVRVRADVRGNDANITTDGPSNHNLKFVIHVPERSDLYVRLTAGDLRIEDIRGNKDVELHAGDVRIDVGRAEDYHTVDASVWAGDIKASAFNVHKDGLFRSFDWRGTGLYRLHAKLKAGDLRLYTSSTCPAC